MKTPAQGEALAKAPPVPIAAPPIMTSQELFRGHVAVLIEHQGQHYRLRATRQGKLILTK